MPIEVTGLHHTYLDGTPFATKVLHGVDLRVEDGEFVGLIGPTRAGKSTLAQFLNGLFLPRVGKVVVDGIDTAAKNVDLMLLRQKVGLVFQYPEHQLFAETVGKDIAFGPKNLGLPVDEVKSRVEQALLAVGLDPDIFWDRYIFALSGGQKRRVAIAGVLALQPKVLILDDPTAGLDPRGRDEILGTVRQLHRTTGATILLISGSLEEVAALTDRVVVMDQGRVVADGPTRQIFSQVDLLRSTGLGVLPTVELMHGLRSRGYDVPLDVLTPDEAAAVIQQVVLTIRKGDAV
jgi:energy-coupling factor transport system ATP-binding protein